MNRESRWRTIGGLLVSPASPFAGRLVVLSASGALSGVSTLVVFAVVAHDGSVQAVARLGVILSLSGVIAYVADAGTTGVAIRATATAGAPRTVLRAVVTRRVLAGFALGGLSGLGAGAVGWGVAESLALGSLATATTLYGAAILVTQARQAVHAQAACNAGKFLLSAAVAGILWVREPDVALAAAGLTVAAATPALAVIIGAGLLTAQRRSLRMVTVPVAIAATSFAVTLHAPVALVAVLGPQSTVADFAADERIAFGLLAVTNAVASLAYPAAARSPGASAVALRALTGQRMALAVCLLGLLALPLTLVGQWLVSPALVDVVTLAPLVIAQGLFALAALPLAVLYAHGRLKRVAGIATTQAVVVGGSCLTAGAMESPTVAALGTCLAAALFLVGARHEALALAPPPACAS